MVRHLLNMHETLSSNPSNARNNQPLKVSSRGEILHSGLKSKLGCGVRGRSNCNCKWTDVRKSSSHIPDQDVKLYCVYHFLLCRKGG